MATDNNSLHPAYFQLYEKIKNEITAGIYKYNDKLPSKRVAASDSNVSVITVAHAYDILIEEGYVEARPKSGYFVAYKEDDFLHKADENSNKIWEQPSRSAQENQLYVHAAGEISFNIIAKAMRKTLLDCGEKILERTPNRGLEELRYEISRYLAKTVGIEVDWNQIVIGAGAEYLYGLISQLFDDKKCVAIERPGYEKIQKVYEREGKKVERLYMGEDGILSSELAASNADILHVTPFHSYPSNISAGISKKREYISWAGKSKIIVEDNYDSELTVSQKMDTTIYSLSPNENVIYINTFSRTISPSLRMGYMVLPKALLDDFDAKVGFYSCPVPAFEQYVICELIKNGDYERHINRIRRRLRQKREILL